MTRTRAVGLLLAPPRSVCDSPGSVGITTERQAMGTPMVPTRRGSGGCCAPTPAAPSSPAESQLKTTLLQPARAKLVTGKGLRPASTVNP